MTKELALDPKSLVGVGQALLCLSFGVAILLHQRRGDLRPPFERFAVGFLCLMFFIPLIGTLEQLASLLTEWVSKQGDPEGIKAILFQAYQKSGATTDQEGGKALVPEIVLQIWRTGVWAVAKSLSELLFLTVALMLENARAIFWKVLFFMMPISIGFFPIAPKLLSNSLLFFVELALWMPVLKLIQVASVPLARAAHQATGTLGVPIIAIELLSALLYLSIPVFTHRFVSGALAGDLDQSHKPISTAARNVGRLAGRFIS